MHSTISTMHSEVYYRCGMLSVAAAYRIYRIMTSKYDKAAALTFCRCSAIIIYLYKQGVCSRALRKKTEATENSNA